MKYLIDADWIIDHLNGIPILGMEGGLQNLRKGKGKIEKGGGNNR